MTFSDKGMETFFEFEITVPPMFEQINSLVKKANNFYQLAQGKKVVVSAGKTRHNKFIYSQGGREH